MTVPRGSLVVMDGRTYHRGGANTAATRRPVFYFTFASERGLLPEGSTYSISAAMKDKYVLRDLAGASAPGAAPAPGAVPGPGVPSCDCDAGKCEGAGLAALLCNALAAPDFLQTYWTARPLWVRNADRRRWGPLVWRYLHGLALDTLLEGHEDCYPYSSAALYNDLVDQQQRMIDLLQPVFAQLESGHASRKVCQWCSALQPRLPLPPSPPAPSPPYGCTTACPVDVLLRR